MSKKISSIIYDINYADQDQPFDKNFQKLQEGLEAFVKSGEDKPDSNLIESIKLFFENQSIAPDKKVRIIDILKKSQNLNFLAVVLELNLFIGSGMKREAFDRIVTDPRFRTYDGTVNLLVNSISTDDDYPVATTFLSELGVFRDDIFLRTLELTQESGFWEKITNNIKNSGKRMEYIDYLEFKLVHLKDRSTVSEFVGVLSAIGDCQKVTEKLAALKMERITETEDLLSLSKLFEQCRDFENALKATRAALSNDPKRLETRLSLAGVLSVLGRNAESYKILQELHADYPDNKDVLKLLVREAYACNDYGEFLRFVSILEPGDISLSDMEHKIDSEIRESRYDDAEKDIRTVLSGNPTNLNVNRMKLKLQISLGKESEAMETAKTLVGIDPNDRDGAEYILRGLYERKEFTQFIEKFKQVGYRSEDMTAMFAASLLNTGDLRGSIGIMKSNPEVLSRGYFLDAVFRISRMEEDLSAMEAETQAIKSFSRNFDIVSGFLRGFMDFDLSELLNAATATSSVAIGWVACLKGIDFKSRTVPGELDKMMSKAHFAGLRILTKTITDIYAGNYREDIRDSSFFMYPVSTVLLELGRTDDAATKIEESYDKRNPDPFYFFVTSRLQAAINDYTNSLKSARKAIGALRNNRFINHSIQISLKAGDRNALLWSLSELKELGREEAFPAELVYGYIAAHGDDEVLKAAFDVLEHDDSRDIWINRIKRDWLLKNGRGSEALPFSEKIVNNREAKPEDLALHADILVNSGKAADAVQFLATRVGENQHLIIKLAGILMSLKRYDEASVLYSRIDLSAVSGDTLSNFCVALMETGDYAGARTLIERYNLGTLLQGKLYLKSRDLAGIRSILGNLNPSDTDQRSLLSEIAKQMFQNSEIRSAILEIYRKSGSLELGDAIADLLENSGNLDQASTIRKAIYRKNPEDSKNLCRLADDYEGQKFFSDAVALLRKWLKTKADSKDFGQVVSKLIEMYFNKGFYEEAISTFETFKQIPDSKTLMLVIRSYMEIQEYETADSLLGKYQDTLIDSDLLTELKEEMALRRNFFEIVNLTRRLLVTEFKLGRTLEISEAVSVAEIPLDTVDLVYQFLGETQYYEDINETKYEMLSADIIQRSVKRRNLTSIHELKINIIYGVMQRPNVLVAKNMYLYVKGSVEKKWKITTEDPELNKLLRSALRAGLKPEPLQVAYELGVGISQAMKVIRLMEHVARISGGS